MNNKTQNLPVIALRGKVAFPDTVITFDVAREKSLAAKNAAASAERLVFLVAQRDIEKEDIAADNLFTVGTVAEFLSDTVLPSGAHRFTFKGLFRAEASEYDFSGDYILAVSVAEIKTIHGEAKLEEAYFNVVRTMVREIRGADGKLAMAKETLGELDTCGEVERYVNIAANSIFFKWEQKQQILSTEREVERLRLLADCLNDLVEIARIERKIVLEVKKSLDQNQKEYFLREQIKAIRNELGDDSASEQDEYKTKIEKKGMPDEIKEKALKELSRMGKMQPSMPEYSVIRTYLDWMIDIPWSEKTVDTESLTECSKVLDAEHYGLKEIKQRIIEYLAVLKLTGKMHASILCFVGPPGVGKTSVASSIAKALGRKFVRMSLGGVKDEAEIRGHRRTYIGAMPGRIIYGMKEAGVTNPVFLLDEVDKISSDVRGDPASALLEVLDPEQNSTFRDRFIEEPYDLSNVLFITTANTVDTIPQPLLDRMEIIRLSGYTYDEKNEIAKRYLVPKKIKENGLENRDITFTSQAIDDIIEYYTMEAGVRGLEKQIDSICRKIAVRVARRKNSRFHKVTVEEAEKMLGAKKYVKEKKDDAPNEVGSATGLAWTAVGGTTLTIEVSTMPGKGEIILTGQLGDVMKESARAAISYIRAHAEKYGIPDEAFSSKDIHIHVPAGAIPKDGPSAGITMATAILSAFTGKPVRKDVAMTGEITLRGKVLPIGGLKEKALAAHRLGIKNIIIPKENERDEQELPKKILGDINFILAENISTVFDYAIAQ